MRDGVWTQMDATRVAQGLDAAVVGNHIAELDDLRNATEMFDKTRSTAERLACEIVDGDLPVVKIGVGDSPEVLEDEVLNNAQILADSRRADLLVVADHEHRLAQVQGDQRHHVALAGFIDDDDIEARVARVKVFDHSRKRHDPHGYGPAAFAHFSRRLGTQKRNADPMPLTDATNGVEPADESLALPRRGTARLRGPRTLVDEFNGHAVKLLAEFFAFGLEGFERDTGAAIELIV